MGEVKPYYQDDWVTIYHGDCLEMMEFNFPHECIITDPPYGVGFKYSLYQDTAENFEKISHAIHAWAAASDQMALMIGQRNLWTMPRPKWMLCWAKPGSTRRNGLGGFNEWEPILLYGKWQRIFNDLRVLPDCVNHAKDAAKDHPCPKPEKLLTWLVGLSEGLITDPFMGSGTTLLAAKLLNRKAIGYELDESYCEIAANRMAQEVLAL